MESARTYTFPVILIGIAVLAGGFCVGRAGFYCYQRLQAHKAQQVNAVPGSMVMHKRMYAIKDAMRKGKDDYEFEVVGIQPTLTNP